MVAVTGVAGAIYSYASLDNVRIKGKTWDMSLRSGEMTLRKGASRQSLPCYHLPFPFPLQTNSQAEGQYVASLHPLPLFFEVVTAGFMRRRLGKPKKKDISSLFLLAIGLEPIIDVRGRSRF